ncbi:MAG: hypothetical protein PUF03_04845 [Lachnospiraceae bacterium]|nr:hypothetical protein [Lachnospiraceae bacterium]
MLELIIIIIIVMVIVKKKKGDALKGQGGKGTMPNTTVTTAKPETNRPYNGTYAAGGTYSTGGSGSQHRPSQRNTRKTAIQEAKEDGNSTTAYLMEKAEADAREHAKEKYEEQQRLQQASGGLAVAERLLDGDPIPQGKRCVICGYCAAENLVPMVPRTRYSCYFCREPLN